MKAHIVTRANRARYSDILNDMHRQRAQLFVQQKGWKALRIIDGMEIDDYDDDNAVYIVALDRHSNLKGSLRLLPSWRRSLMHERLSNFVTSGAAPVGPDIWEWTRWHPGDSTDARSLVQARKVLIVGAMEFALARGIHQFTAVCETYLLPQLIELGWNPRPLGGPTQFDEGTAIAVCWDVKATTLQCTKEMLCFRGVAAVEAPAACHDEAMLAPFTPALFAAAANLSAGGAAQNDLLEAVMQASVSTRRSSTGRTQ